MAAANFAVQGRFGGAAGAVRRWLRAFYRPGSRQLPGRLEGLNDRMLGDIGLTRHDVGRGWADTGWWSVDKPGRHPGDRDRPA